MPVDEDQLNDLIGRFITDLGATVHAGNVVIGDRLGLYRALSEIGPADAAALAHHTGTSERYLREWLAGQAAGGYLSTDVDARTFWLTDAQHLALVDPDGIGMAGAFLLAVACLQDEPKITDAENFTPVGRLYYNFSTMLCVPHAIAYGAGDTALGNQAGEAAVHPIATAAGFTRVRRATETPFNIIYEVRP